MFRTRLCLLNGITDLQPISFKSCKRHSNDLLIFENTLCASAPN